MMVEVLDFAKEKTNELLAADSCCPEVREAAENWLKAIGTDEEAEETKRYLATLEENVMPIDDLLELCESEVGMAAFGEEEAKEMVAHAMGVKAEGGKYCDCPACTAALAILDRKDDMLL